MAKGGTFTAAFKARVELLLLRRGESLESEWCSNRRGERRPQRMSTRDHLNPYPKEFREQGVKVVQASGLGPS